MAMRWYVVHAYSGYEKKVAASLKERIELHGMQDRFGEVLVPTEEVVEMRGGQKRRSERKFFPGYVLVQMELDDDTWHLVKETPRVLGFIGGKADAPAPISEAEANAILNRIEEGTYGVVYRARDKKTQEIVALKKLKMEKDGSCGRGLLGHS